MTPSQHKELNRLIEVLVQVETVATDPRLIEVLRGLHILQAGIIPVEHPYHRDAVVEAARVWRAERWRILSAQRLDRAVEALETAETTVERAEVKP
jgi:uncharacterized protein (DUF2252 family)